MRRARDHIRDLHANSTQLQWMVDFFALVFVRLLLSLGTLGDQGGAQVGVSGRPRGV